LKQLDGLPLLALCLIADEQVEAVEVLVLQSQSLFQVRKEDGDLRLIRAVECWELGDLTSKSWMDLF